MDTFYGYKKGDRIRCKLDFIGPNMTQEGTFDGTKVLLKKGKLYNLHSFHHGFQSNMICEDKRILPMEDDEMRMFLK